METEDGNVIVEKCIGGEKLLKDFVPREDLVELQTTLMDVFGTKSGKAVYDEIYDGAVSVLDTIEEDAKDILEETYQELRASTPYNSGHLQSSIVIRTDGKQSPLYHEVVFSNLIWESNEPAPLTKSKVFYDGNGNMVLGPKGKPYKKRAGYTWEPRADKYDYRKNDEVRTPEGSIYDEAYVEEYFNSIMARKGY